MQQEKMGPIVVLKLPDSAKELIAYAQGVHDAMENNAYFPAPTPTMAVFGADIAAFVAAEAKASTKTSGAAQARNAKRLKVKKQLAALRAYVQSVAEMQPTEADAVAVVESAHMRVRQPTSRTRAELRASGTGTTGEVRLDAAAVASVATYFWQYSVDQITWIDAAETMTAHTMLSGLASARVHYFRFRALTRKGKRDFSQVVRFVVP